MQQSFAKVAPIADQAAVMFYNWLFEVAPQVRAMFPGDITAQRQKLMATISVVVSGLSNLESVLPAASALAGAKSWTLLRKFPRLDKTRDIITRKSPVNVNDVLIPSNPVPSHHSAPFVG